MIGLVTFTVVATAAGCFLFWQKEFFYQKSRCQNYEPVRYYILNIHNYKF